MEIILLVRLSPTARICTELTQNGGANEDRVVFKIKPEGSSYTKLLDFDGATNGGNAAGSLISDGTYLYGMTSIGGVYTDGVMFKIKPDGSSYTKLLDFAGTTGSGPQGSLISDGTYLYGMTLSGGANYGVVFKIKPDGSGYAKMLDFDGTTNGKWPYGSLISDGTYLHADDLSRWCKQ